MHYQGLRSASGSHHDALRILDGCRELDAATREGLRKHLLALLSQKTFAQYDGRLLDEPEADSALAHMERALGLAQGIAAVNGWLA